ncbi:MAG: PAS domain S-box protein [Nitrospirota bacterium]
MLKKKNARNSNQAGPPGTPLIKKPCKPAPRRTPCLIRMCRQEAEALFAGVRAVLETHNFQDSAEAIFQSCKKLTRARAGYIALVSEDGTRNEVAYLDSGGMPCSVDPDHPMPIRGLRGKVYRSGTSSCENDFARSEHQRYIPEGHAALKNVLMVPMKIRGKVVGLLGLANKRTDFTGDDIRVAERFGELAAVALMNKRNEEVLRSTHEMMERRIQERTEELMNANQALMKSEQKYRMLIEQASDGIFILDRQGNIDEVNTTACHMLGYDRDELIRLTILDIIPEEDLRRHPLKISEVLAGERVVIQRRFRKQDGTFIDVEVSAKKIETDRLQTIVRDLTERKKAQEALRASEERLAEAQKIAHLGNWDWDIRTNELYWSEEIYSIFGLTPGQFASTYDAFLSSVHPDDRQLVNSSVNEALYGAPYSIDHRIVLPDGSIRHVHEQAKVLFGESGEPVRMIGTVQDITVRKEAEKALQDSKAKYQAIVEGFDGYIYICNDQNDIEFMNERLTGHLGYSAVGEKCYRALHGFENICPWCQNRRREHDEVIRGELNNPENNRWYYVVSTPIRNEDGTVSSMMMLQDITEKKENEVRLLMSEKLAALGQMASGIAHELNNPLATISACTEGLLNRIRKGSVDRELFESYLQIINEEVSRSKGITTNMLSFVRKTGTEKKESDLNAMLDKTLELIGFQGRLKNVEVVRHYTERVSVRVNEGEMRQVLLSLIANALDSMEDRGTLTLSTGIRDQAALIEIADTGPGIPPELVNKIFDPFFTTRSDRGGTGLGLSIAKKILDDSGGTLDVQTGGGHGVTFRIVIPL